MLLPGRTLSGYLKNVKIDIKKKAKTSCTGLQITSSKKKKKISATLKC